MNFFTFPTNMASQFFLYRPKVQNLPGNQICHPSFEFLKRYTELVGVAEIQDKVVPENMYKTLPNGQISGLRVGKLEWDTAGMSALNFLDTEVVAELVNFGRDFAIKTVSKEELTGFIRAYTNTPEREPDLFVISEESSEVGMERQRNFLI